METYAEYLARTQKEQQQKSAGAASIVIGAQADSGVTPDQAAADMKLAQDYAKTTGGAPPPLDMVAQDRSTFQREIEQRRNAQVLGGNPMLSEWLRDPKNAAIAADSVEELSWWEGVGRGGGAIPGQPSSPEAQDAARLQGGGLFGNVVAGVEAAGRGFGRGTVKAAAGTQYFATRGAAQAYGDVGKTRDEIYQSILTELGIDDSIDSDPALRNSAMTAAMIRYDAISGMEVGDPQQKQFAALAAEALKRGDDLMKYADSIPLSEAGKRAADLIENYRLTAVPERWKQYQREMFAWNGEGEQPVEPAPITTPEKIALAFDTLTRVWQESPTDFLAFAGDTLSEAGPGIVAGTATTMATGNPLAGAGVMGATSATSGYGDQARKFLQEQGIEIETLDDALKVVTDPAILDEMNRRGSTYGLIVGILDAASGGIAGKALVKNPFADVLVQTLLQATLGSTGEAVGSYAATGKVDWLDVLMEGLLEAPTAIPEMIGVGGRGWLEKQGEKARNARATQERLQGFVDAATQSVVRTRAPDAFRQFIARTTAGQDAETMYVPADKFEEYFQSKGMTVEDVISQLDGVNPDQVAEALATGGDIAIPTATFAAKIAGSEHDTFLLQNSRFDPEGMTFTEAEAWESDKAGLLTEAMGQAEEMRARAAVEIEAGQQIYDTMTQRITEAGWTADKAKKEASAYRAFYETRAARSGQSVATLLERYPLPEVRGAAQQPAAEAGRALVEAANEPLDNLSLQAAVFQSTENTVDRPDGALSIDDALFVLDFLRDQAERGKLTPEMFAASDIGQRLDTSAIMKINEALRADPVATVNALYGAIEAKGNRGVPDPTEGGLYDQTGRAAVDSEPFKQWFGKSAVTDGEGAPLVVYHHGSFDENNDTPSGAMHFGTGQAARERAFGKAIDDAAMAVEAYQGEDGVWHWADGSGITSEDMGAAGFSDEETAIAYGRSEVIRQMEDGGLDLDESDLGSTTAVYLNIQNPKRVADVGGANGEWDAVIEQARAEGYDGIVYRNQYEDKGSDSYIAFDPTQIKSVNNRGTFDRSDPNILNQNGVPLFDRPLTIDGKVTVRAIGEAMTADHLAKHERQYFPENSEEDYQAVLGWMGEEITAQLGHPNSGVGWYGKDVQLSIELAARVYPSLLNNPTHRDLFLTFAGLFSNGAEPEGAFMMSSEAFEHFLATGEIPVSRADASRARGEQPKQTSFKDRKTGADVSKDAGWGIRNPANEQQLAFVKHIIEREGGVEAGINWLRSPQKRTAINAAMTESGLYKAGRYTTKAEIAGPDALGIMAFGEKLGRYTMGLHGVDIDAGDTTIDLWYSRTYRRLTGRLLETPIGNEGVVSGPTDQDRKVIFRLTGDLVKQFDLPAGDVQAVLWFWEKRLWGAQGLRTNEGTNSSGARKLLRSKGLDDGTGSDGQGDGAGSEAAGREYAQAGRGDGGAGYASGGLAPLAGAPTVEGASGPDPRLVAVAEGYARSIGLTLQRQAEFVEVDPERAARIAAAYEAMPHAPNDPRVREAFENLIEQTKAQYQALVDGGYEFYFIDPENDPYGGNPWNAMRDLRANRRMAVFPTEAGFGSNDAVDTSGNPMEVDTGLEWSFGTADGPKKRVLANDLFRAVHDAFGHGLEGAGFRARGEENAWQAHVRLFQGSAVAAITTETRGQNSWLNYGPNGAANQTASVEDTVFADQKTGLLPEWAWLEGRAGDEQPVLDERGFRYIESRPQLPIGADGKVELTHWSDEKRDVINPQMGGTGPLVGPDRRAQRKWSFFGIDARTSRAQPGIGYVKEMGLGDWRHTVKVDPARLYPWYEDPDGIKDRLPRTERYNVDSYARAIKAAGYLGHYVTDDGGGSAILGVAAAVYEPLPVERAMDDAADQGEQQGRMYAQTLFSQPETPAPYNQTNRGSIMFPAKGIASGQTVINTFKDADLSTVLHESGHFFLKLMQAEAARGEASAIAEMDAMKAWWLSNAGDVAKDASRSTGVAVSADDVTRAISFGSSGDFQIDNAIDVGMQEQFARGFEAYLMKGEAPSAELRSIFASFSAWLKSIYRSLPSLNVKVSPEMKAVFDRMLATDAEIAKASQREADHAALFSDANTMGLSPEDFAKYQTLATQAQDEAKAKLTAEVMAPIRRATEKWYREQKAALAEKLLAAKKAMPIYRAIQEMRFGQTFEGEETPGIKLNRKAIEQVYGADVLARLPGAPKTGKGHRWAVYASGDGGMHPDVIAGMYGFETGRELIEALLSTPLLDVAVDADAEAEMLQRHGDVLKDGRIEQKAMDAIKNDKKARLIAMELGALNAKIDADKGLKRSALFPKITHFREMARRTIDRLPLRDARAANRYVSAAKKAADEAFKALAKGDLRGAAEAKRRHLLAHMMYMEARKIDTEVDKLVTRLGKLNRPDSKQAKGVNIDNVKAARAIAGKFGLATPDSTFDFDMWVEQLREDDPTTAASLAHAIQTYTQNAKPFAALTVGEFRAVADAVANLISLGKSARLIEVEGQQMSKDEAIADLMAVLAKRGLSSNPALQKKLTGAQRMGRSALSMLSALRRVENWARDMDDGVQGPFTRYLVRPVMDALGVYRDQRAAKLDALLKIINPIRKDVLTGGAISAPELGYTFESKAELLHAILHTGNESNLEKLLMGRGWSAGLTGQQQKTTATGRASVDRQGNPIMDRGRVDTTRWDTFVARMIAEGKLTKQDYDIAQSIWDLMDELKRPAQSAHRKMFGFYFNEVEASPVVTPFGTYRGGYVPAVADQDASNDGQIRADQNAMEMQQSGFMFPTTGNGFTKSRVQNYRTALSLDLMLLPAHMDKVLRFTHLEPVVRQTAGILTARDMREGLDAYDQSLIPSMLTPWLQRTAQQAVEARATTPAGRAFSSIARELRRRVGIHTMFMNVVNTAQQITGFSTAMVLVKPHRLSAALGRYTAGGAISMRAEAMAQSAFMRERVSGSARETQRLIKDAVVKPTIPSEMRALIDKHGYALQQITQNIMDVIIWHGAYDQAISKGADDADAVFEADSVVRRTIGDFAAENISLFETGNAFTRLFTMFYSYFNGQANLVGGEMQTAMRTLGWNGAPRMFWIYLFGIAAPAIVAELIVRGFRGDLDDEDDDGYEDEIAALTLGAQGRYITAMVPIAGQITMALINRFNDQVYDDRLSTSPVVSTVERAAGAPASIGSALFGEGGPKRAVLDGMTALGLISGIPMGQLTKMAGYGIDVSSGKAQPEGPMDVVQGIASGRDGTAQ